MTWKLRARKFLFLTGDAALLVGSLLAAVWLRFDGRVPAEVWAQVPLAAALSLAVRMPVFATQRLYALSWSQVSLDDMIAVFRGVTLSTLLFWLAVFALKQEPGWLVGFPRAALLLEYLITLHAISGFRLGRRVYRHLLNRSSAGRRALIVGAGAAGEQLARSLRATPTSGLRPLGFVDDDPRKVGNLIHGLPVLGPRERLGEIVRSRGVEVVLIAMPSAPSRVIRKVVSHVREAGVQEIRVIPGLDRILSGSLTFSDLREVQLEDLLGREVVQIDLASVEAWLRDRTVLVTGAGGSIGSELCRQVARFHPSRVVLLDYDETAVFLVEQELQRQGQLVVTCLTDIRDAVRVAEVIRTHRPDVVFHAAAFKHVGLMERHPDEAVRTNVLGTLAVAEASAAAGVGTFVLISTDKAVNPTAVMGATKRVAEQVVQCFNARSATRFVAVRFGNVLGSRGSVVPLFAEKIRRGEPLTVRGGPNMRRYFMAISEAVLLVLQAGAMGRGGEVFVLDMGEPVRIADLAREMLRLSGLEPDKDVPIVFADPEPGEKEHEDLLTAEEGTVATRHDRIFVARGDSAPPADILFAHLDALREHAGAGDLAGIVRTLTSLVPSYRPSEYLRSRINGTLVR